MFRPILIAAAALIATAAAIPPAAGHPAPRAAAADLDCSDFSTQAQAQQHVGGGDPHGLDADGDGIACEYLPCPCSRGGGDGGSRPIPPKPPIARFAGEVVDVVDGDTIRVRHGGRRVTIRLIGIDTPEVFGGRECGGAAASRLMKERALGRKAAVVGDRSQPRRDRYGRLLAYVRARGSGDVGRMALRRGMAKVLVVGARFKRYGSYERTARRARAAGRGSWGRCGRL